MRARIVPVDLEALSPVTARLLLRVYDGTGRTRHVRGPAQNLEVGHAMMMDWEVPDLGGYPVAAVGLEISSAAAASGCMLLDWLDWKGAPRKLSLLATPETEQWANAWTSNLYRVARVPGGRHFSLHHDGSLGLMIQGTRDWRDYTFSGVFQVSLAERFGVAVRVQGLNRYYAVVLGAEGEVRLVKRVGAHEHALALGTVRPLRERTLTVALTANGSEITAQVDDVTLSARDVDASDLAGGAGALLLAAGSVVVAELNVVAVAYPLDPAP